jgi:acyl-coenzyme A synthetase/AMP-(fatty) acid ligase
VNDTKIRAALAADTGLGAGNVLPKLREHGADPDGPAVTFDTDLHRHPAWTPFTLGMLERRVAARAAWLREWGVRPSDPVAVYVHSAADTLLSFLALCWLGAIPALMNGNLPGDVAAEYIRRLRVVGVLTDRRRHPTLAGRDLGLVAGAPGTKLAGRLVVEVGEVDTGDPAAAPEHYRQHADDPVAITHSSGTTRTPAAVVHSHASLFAAVRAVRLTEPRPRGEVRELSALPAAHAAGIITLNQALCNRYQLLFLSAQGGRPGKGGAAVLDAIERWRPTGVFGFAVTWADLARFDLTKRDLSSVRNWFNTGDSAHEAHIRRLIAVGSHQVPTAGGPVTVPGSKFVDGIGSTEMGHSAFRITHAPGTERYGRCVGRPYPFAEVALLDLDSGTEVPVGEVGHVGLRSPTLAPGYWNDSVTTYRNRFRGYYLTGDLMRRDHDGYYYHVDRAVDAVDLGEGNWLYTAMAEERILVRCPDVRDCTVVSGRVGGTVVTDVLLVLDAEADPGLDRTEAVREALGGPAAATLRRVLATEDDAIVTGPTGKARKFLMRQRHLADLAA